jgi:hypothetical protein
LLVLLIGAGICTKVIAGWFIEKRQNLATAIRINQTHHKFVVLGIDHHEMFCLGSRVRYRGEGSSRIGANRTGSAAVRLTRKQTGRIVSFNKQGAPLVKWDAQQWEPSNWTTEWLPLGFYHQSLLELPAFTSIASFEELTILGPDACTL